ncbi:hypothetical protein AL036_00310 [Salipiger aestuarii]|uniref:hypothetical protein n=1 Tax=Salipiger aestuarii TaxID=568098 RepID=UPI00025B65C3|nr:hypothetical protein [Salipiger aestuarii]EIE48882.1 hypothetical protein C357_22020 [Citreicella sp. 357]KAA8610363.1 hypothetical protein AL036_00310 [Salipiger aestuarii]KAA8616378.1 hypothetical protein AL037_00310 [Salipiger aestuarii]KAB2543527.1 hypothetical protein AL035_01680 [Salipiger aestuarii]
MRKILLSTLALATLAACDAQTQDAVARSAARSTASKVVVQRFPGIPVEPSLNCVIDNANAQQIYALASESVTGPTQSSVEIVIEIVSKPETLTCLAAEGLPALIR